MLIHDFVQVDGRVDAVRDRLLASPHGWLADIASAAYADGERLCGRLGQARSDPRPQRVHVDIGRSQRRGDGWVITLNWWATRPLRLFPAMEADLEIMPLGTEAVMLTLMGHYDPPTSGAGEALDRVLLHRIAETSVRSFLRGLECQLQATSILGFTRSPAAGAAHAILRAHRVSPV